MQIYKCDMYIIITIYHDNLVFNGERYARLSKSNSLLQKAAAWIFIFTLKMLAVTDLVSKITELQAQKVLLRDSCFPNFHFYFENVRCSTCRSSS